MTKSASGYKAVSKRCALRRSRNYCFGTAFGARLGSAPALSLRGLSVPRAQRELVEIYEEAHCAERGADGPRASRFLDSFLSALCFT